VTTQTHRMTCALAWMAKTGASATAAAKRYKLTPRAINRAMHRAGIPVPRGTPVRRATVANLSPVAPLTILTVEIGERAADTAGTHHSPTTEPTP
jgi:hypothetical protein